MPDNGTTPAELPHRGGSNFPDEGPRASRPSGGRPRRGRPPQYRLQSLCCWIVSEHLRGFSRLRPDVRVTSHDGLTADILAALEQGTADVAIVRDVQEREDIALTLLTSERLVAVVPADHPATGKDPVAAAELANQPLISFPRSAGAHVFDLYTKPLRDAGIDIQVTQEGSNWYSIVTFAAAGLGVSIVPCSVTSLLPPGARRIEISGPPQQAGST